MCQSDVVGPSGAPTPRPAGTPRADRRADAVRRAELARDAAGREAAAAQVLIDEFVSRATQLGIAPEPLRMQLSGGGTARTDKSGWYLKANRTVAIGADGNYYILTMPGGLRERLFGVQLTNSQPVLQVSRGGRDGETGDLAEFLARRLAPDGQ